MNTLEAEICAHLVSQREAMTGGLAAHVAIPTGKNYSEGLDAYRALIVERLERLGAVVELRSGRKRPGWLRTPSEDRTRVDEDIPPVVVARHADTVSSPRVLFAAHLDTVHDPFGSFRSMEVQPDGVTATGPGVVDMKGGVLVMLAALEALHAQGVKLNWTVLLNSDEETGTFMSEHVLREEAAEHDVGLVVEPALADGSLAVERMGSGQFMIEVFGQSAHVGREFEKGVSAVTELARILTQLAAMAEPAKGMIVNVGPIEGGGVTNAVPAYAACWGNVRYHDAAAGAALGERIDALATEPDAMPRVLVHRHWNRPAKPRTPAVEQLANLARSAAEDLGQTLPFASTGGVCDGNILQDAGLPVIDTLGVRGGNLHRPDEFIELNSLVERAQLLALVILRAQEVDWRAGRA